MPEHLIPGQAVDAVYEAAGLVGAVLSSVQVITLRGAVTLLSCTGAHYDNRAGITVAEAVAVLDALGATGVRVGDPMPVHGEAQDRHLRMVNARLTALAGRAVDTSITVVASVPGPAPVDAPDLQVVRL